MPAEQYTMKDYVNAFWRRSRLFSLVFLSLFTIAVAMAILPADQYRASAEMRIDLEGPNLDVVEPVVLTNYADQYVQTLEQKVMTRDNLRAWLDASDAYQYLGEDVGHGAKVSMLREDLSIQMVFTTVIDEQSGKEVDLVTGFRTVFMGREPNPAEVIANSAAQAFLAEDRATRIAEASAARSFLTEQIDQKSEEIAQIEARIATFKEQNAGRLPDLMVLNMTAIERTERELESVQREAYNLQQDRFFREAQLREMEQRAGGDASRLGDLESEYNRVVALYGPDHPDVIRIRRQVSALTAATATGGSSELTDLEAQLATAQERYSDAHPDVIGLKRRIAELRAGDPFAGSANENPLYLQLKAQINAINTNLQGLRERESELRSDQVDLQERIASMPQVERQFQSLQRDLQTATLAFDGLRERLAQAQQIESFESGERGARLALVRSAEVPNNPAGPARVATIVVGFILALTLAGGAAFVAELSDNTIRGSKDVHVVMQVPAIAVIPVAQNSVSLAQRRSQLMAVSIGVFLLVAIFLLATLRL